LAHSEAISGRGELEVLSIRYAVKIEHPGIVRALVSSWNDVGFQSGTSALAKTSRFSGAGDDGKDVGADAGAIAAAQANGRGADGCGGVGTAVPR